MMSTSVQLLVPVTEDQSHITRNTALVLGRIRPAVAMKTCDRTRTSSTMTRTFFSEEDRTMFCICVEYSVRYSVQNSAHCSVQYSAHCSVQCSVQYSVQNSVHYSGIYNLQKTGKGFFVRELVS